MRLAKEGASGLTLVDVSRATVEETRALVAAASPSCVVIVVVADVAGKSRTLNEPLPAPSKPAILSPINHTLQTLNPKP